MYGALHCNVTLTRSCKAAQRRWAAPHRQARVGTGQRVSWTELIEPGKLRDWAAGQTSG